MYGRTIIQNTFWFISNICWAILICRKIIFLVPLLILKFIFVVALSIVISIFIGIVFIKDLE